MSGATKGMVLAMQAPFGAGPLPQVTNIGTQQQQQLCFLCYSYLSHTRFSSRERGSQRAAMPTQDIKVLSLCVPGAKGKKEKKPKLLGADSCRFVRLASSHKATKALISEVKYYELPESLEPKSTHHLTSGKSLLQHLRMSP